MPPPSPQSNIRAFVQWREPSVYAGEGIECVITFKNVAISADELKKRQEGDGVSTPLGNAFARASRAPSVVHSRRSSVAQSRGGGGGGGAFSRAPSVGGNTVGTRQPSGGRGHKPALSLNVVSGPSARGGGLHSAPLQSRTPSTARPGKGHGRSLSIMSLGSEAPSEGRTPTAMTASKKATKGHGRSASLQITTRPSLSTSPSLNATTFPRQPSPLYESTTPPALPESEGSSALRPPRRRPGTASAGSTPRLGQMTGSVGGGALNEGFQFPPRPPDNKTPPELLPRLPRSPSTMHSAQLPRSHSPRMPPDGWSGTLSSLNPISRVMSEASTGGTTPRSSGEFYSTANGSDETIPSELYQNRNGPGRLGPHKSSNTRDHTPSPRKPGYTPTAAPPETLMMGFAQTMGHFTLDGSLVNAAPFEEVKRRGVQGNGGVVGLEKPSKRASGMFGAFGWGNIGESLGGLLGGSEAGSTLAQMKADAGSRSIPLLSTPQSLLFVDLILAPGESRSYTYRFTLPRGLPPSHRGRAVKVGYHLTIGVQRPGGQAVKHVEVPFRVLGSVTSRGEVLGHDLMSPYILLQDAARTSSIARQSSPVSSPGAFSFFPPKEPSSKTTKTPKQGLEDFLRYTERLLSEPKDSNGALLSPTSPGLSPTMSRRESMFDTPPATSAKEAIDFAILRANQISQARQKSGEGQTPNRFNIARSGAMVGVLTLIRPAFRLGEEVIGTIDLTVPAAAASGSSPPAQIPTYAVHISLESAERVDPSLALRSGTSIQRVTRKIHAAKRDNALFARRIAFNLAVPPAATPTFETTGVSLVWTLRVEFTTSRLAGGGGMRVSPGDNGEVEVEGWEEEVTGELLEGLARDDRGSTLIAKEMLRAETFEVAVPVKVYGAMGVEGGVGEEVEGLVV